MELPETCLTNVFKIVSYIPHQKPLSHPNLSAAPKDNFSDIPYSIYRISSTIGSAPAWRVLNKAETNLRRQGKCVTTCSETLELWLFQPDHNDGDVAFTSDSGYSTYDGSGTTDKGWEPMVWGLEEKAKDVLRMQELFDILKPPSLDKSDGLLPVQSLSQPENSISPGTQLDPIDLSGTNRDVYMLQQLSKQRVSNKGMSAIASPVTASKSNASTIGTPRLSTLRPISKQELVAQKCLMAIMSLLSYRLATSFNWIPLNLCSFIARTFDEPANMGIFVDSRYGESSLEKEQGILSHSAVSPGPALLTTISLSLLEDGSLHVVPKTVPQHGLQRFPSIDIPEPSEEDVWLAPSGIIGRRTPKAISNSDSQATPEWKAFVLKSLSDRGIKLGQQTLVSWTRIGIWSDIEGFTQIFWPTPLIFVRKLAKDDYFAQAPLATTEIKLKKSMEPEKALATQLTWFNTEDSLDFAEKWLANAASREVERKRRLEAKSKIVPEAVADRKRIAIAPTTDRSNTVYPTPPDAVATMDGLHTPGGPTTAPTPGQMKLPEEPPAPVVEPPTAPPTTEATAVNSTEMDLDDQWMKDADTSKTGDDMFETVQDVGMAGGDGLEDELFDITEDDFGFFDNTGTNDEFIEMNLEKPQSLAEVQARPVTSASSEMMNELNTGFSALDTFGDDTLLEMELDLDDIGAAMDMQAGAQSYGGLPSSQPAQNQSQAQDSSSQPNGGDHQLVRVGSQTEGAENGIVQVETPPLSPQRAMKLLLLDSAPPKGSLDLRTRPPVLNRRQSLYSPVDFPSFIGRSDEKYMAGGRFFYAEDESTPRKKSSENRKFSATFPRIKKYRNSRRPVSRDILFLEDDEERSDLMPDTGSSDEESTTTDDYGSEDEEMFEISNEGGPDASSYSNSLSPEGVRQGVKRKRNLSERDYWGGNKVQSIEAQKSDRQTDLDSAPEWSVDMATLNDKDTDNLSSAQRSLCDFIQTDISLEGIFNLVPDNDNISNRLSSHDFTYIVQLLQEQVVWNTYLISAFSPTAASGGRISCIEIDGNGAAEEPELAFHLQKQTMAHQDDVEDLLTELFGGFVSRCSLDMLLFGTTGRPRSSLYGVSPGSVDIHGLSTGLTPINRPKSSSDALGESLSLFRINPPHVHVHRNAATPNSPIELLPPALHFWDTFGLAPHSGPKDFLTTCVFPREIGLANAAKMYLNGICTTYESCRLGENLLVKTSQILDGLHEIPMRGQEKATIADEKAMLRRYCEGIAKMGETLVEIEDELQNVVLMIVNPFSAPSAVLDICAAFHILKKTYAAALNSSIRVYPNNIILQIVPISHLAAQDGIVVQSHNQSIRCALEIYERCTQTIQDHPAQKFPQETYSPCMTLAKPVPKSIAFKVSSDPSPAILQENMCLHMAYAQSIDERWISVAWGDDCGEIKEVASFCLGIPGTVLLRAFEDICKEIWAITNRIISKKRIHWRISLVKVGTVDDDEIEVWTKLSNESAISNTLTTFASDPAPPLTFKYALYGILPQAFTGQAQGVGTPGGTPQSSGVSPDQFGTSQGGALTPGDSTAPEVDNDIAVVDFTDETWGAVLQHPLNNSDSIIKTRPALASGLLIKRTGPSEADEPAILALSLICAGQRKIGSLLPAPTLPESNEDMLREALTQYRGLMTLGQHLGVIDVMKEVLPWHIAAVIKCRDAFTCVL
ncbi:Mediator of RNA polymerase II transcription subunit [Drechslerella dactyloides]|uniref:Mediator of RNA polymerase II transcription subunit 13 n=1 Tax=Drechslerella dactyloides TaxID=74499 RepID=A0AAD6IZ44_DREDA|nr:Mediator of RNA polymerase II transcription subunit [Drechslerella dactyloides]